MWIQRLFIAALLPVAAFSQYADVGTQAHQLRRQSNPDFALTCYHCEVSVLNFKDCNSTKACEQGNQCLLREMMSTVDGHHDYLMACGTAYDCDGGEMPFPVGKRDVNRRNIAVSCCSNNLCNTPPPPTTVHTDPAACMRDVVLIVQDSRNLTSTARRVALKAMLHGIVDAVHIGTDGALLELSFIEGNKMNHQWDLDHYANKKALQSAISRMNPDGHGGVVDINATLTYIRDVALTSRNGDRPNVPNDIIIMVESQIHVNASSFQGWNWTEQELRKLSGDVIVIEVGTNEGNDAHQIANLATDSNHVIKVADYLALQNISARLVSLLCS
ncbi:collagen alpha-1(XII) chain-like [Dreissena polymorpha]|uniref:VWFA domain-containing protein n=1 Tax=Dreissena polymorpha TaxID=45954 RepID=A0A9D4H5M8_DREPO|nr:collagen alpha-1(XII) chain-like [Dreissena polymorpha]KAH3825767.1 hypothetical protein DPMN_127648 [Dreissena polymorpha]